MIQNKISDIVKNSPIEEDPKHSILTRKWLLKICPDASEDMQIAALAHDIERAVPPRIRGIPGENYDQTKQRHAKRSADIAAKIMEEIGFIKEDIAKVKHLIENHEVGGDKESDYLRDADSIAYFEYNVNLYFKRNGAEKTKDKIMFMFGRCSERAKKMIQQIDFKPEIRKLF